MQSSTQHLCVCPSGSHSLILFIFFSQTFLYFKCRLRIWRNPNLKRKGHTQTENWRHLCNRISLFTNQFSYYDDDKQNYVKELVLFISIKLFRKDFINMLWWFDKIGAPSNGKLDLPFMVLSIRKYPLNYQERMGTYT